jgi:hypothetical protein
VEGEGMKEYLKDKINELAIRTLISETCKCINEFKKG